MLASEYAALHLARISESHEGELPKVRARLCRAECVPKASKP